MSVRRHACSASIARRSTTAWNPRRGSSDVSGSFRIAAGAFSHHAAHRVLLSQGPTAGATLEALIYAITHDEGIVKVSGEVGSGKTMLCRMLLEKLPGHVETVYLANPLLSRTKSSWPLPGNCEL
jgi:type IV secretory pathway ATPase VirB11/archaellum biosynthesis ATPase